VYICFVDFEKALIVLIGLKLWKEEWRGRWKNYVNMKSGAEDREW